MGRAVVKTGTLSRELGRGTLTNWHRRRDLMLLQELELIRQLIYDSRSLLTPSSGGQGLSLGHQEGGEGKSSIHGQGRRA